MIKNLGIASGITTVLTCGSREAMARESPEYDYALSQHHCDNGAHTSDPRYTIGCRAEVTSIDIGYYYEHWFRFSTYYTGRADTSDGKAYDLNRAVVDFLDQSGVRYVDFHHKGASPGKHENANGSGSPESVSALDSARDVILYRTSPPPRSNDYHVDNYEEGATVENDKLTFEYNYGNWTDRNIADHAHQVVARVETESSSEFVFENHAKTSTDARPTVQLFVETSGASMTTDFKRGVAGDRQSNC